MIIIIITNKSITIRERTETFTHRGVLGGRGCLLELLFACGVLLK